MKYRDAGYFQEAAKKWLEEHRSTCPSSATGAIRTRGGEVSLSVAIHYLPYLLAPAYYSLGLVREVRDMRRRKREIRKVGQKLAKLVPPECGEKCLEELQSVIQTLESSGPNPPVTVVVDPVFVIWRQHCPGVKASDKDLLSSFLEHGLAASGADGEGALEGARG